MSKTLARRSIDWCRDLVLGGAELVGRVREHEADEQQCYLSSEPRMGEDDEELEQVKPRCPSSLSATSAPAFAWRHGKATRSHPLLYG